MQDEFPKNRDRMSLVLSCFEREDNLKHQRLSWALQVNIAVLGAIILGYSVNPELGRFLQGWGSGVGFAFTALSLAGIRAADRQFDYLKDYLRDNLDRQPAKEKSVGDEIFDEAGLPRPYGEQSRFDVGRYAPMFYCLIIGLFWSLSLFSIFYPQHTACLIDFLKFASS